VSVELFCAPNNHPEQVAKVKKAAAEFAQRTKEVFVKAKSVVVPKVTDVTLSIKQVAGDVSAYAFGHPSAE